MDAALHPKKAVSAPLMGRRDWPGEEYGDAAPAGASAASCNETGAGAACVRAAASGAGAAPCAMPAPATTVLVKRRHMTVAANIIVQAWPDQVCVMHKQSQAGVAAQHDVCEYVLLQD